MNRAAPLFPLLLLAGCAVAAKLSDPPLAQLARWRSAAPDTIASEPVVAPCPAANPACPRLHALRAEACLGRALATRAPGAACPPSRAAPLLDCAAEGYAVALAAPAAAGAPESATARPKLHAGLAQALLCRAELDEPARAAVRAAAAADAAGDATPPLAALHGARAALLLARLGPAEQRCPAARRAHALAATAPSEHRARARRRRRPPPSPLLRGAPAMTTVLDRDLSFRFPLLSGEDVRAVQQALIRAGAMRSEADGVFGPLTRDAVLVLQRRAGLPADGVLRRGIWDRLLPAAPPAPRPPAPDWRDMLRPFLPRLCVPHGSPLGRGPRRWRLTPSGVVLDDDDAPPRSPGPPRTASLAWDRFRAPIGAAAARFGVPVELLLATACTESGGRADALREEPGYVSDERTPQRVSPGLMQTLIGTAREALGDPSIDRARLLDPATSLLAGAALIRRQAVSGRCPTAFDPPLVCIAYNAGSLRESAAAADCPWGLVQTRRDARHWHADSFVAFLNDGFAVLADAPPDAGTPSFSTILSETS